MGGYGTPPPPPSWGREQRTDAVCKVVLRQQALAAAQKRHRRRDARRDGLAQLVASAEQLQVEGGLLVGPKLHLGRALPDHVARPLVGVRPRRPHRADAQACAAEDDVLVRVTLHLEGIRDTFSERGPAYQIGQGHGRCFHEPSHIRRRLLLMLLLLLLLRGLTGWTRLCVTLNDAYQRGLLDASASLVVTSSDTGEGPVARGGRGVC